LGDPIEQRFRRASFSFREKADRVWTATPKYQHIVDAMNLKEYYLREISQLQQNVVSISHRISHQIKGSKNYKKYLQNREKRMNKVHEKIIQYNSWMKNRRSICRYSHKFETICDFCEI
jgi:DNA repair ATPase RecN